MIDKSIIAENTKIGEGAILGIGSEEPNKLKTGSLLIWTCNDRREFCNPGSRTDW